MIDFSALKQALWSWANTNTPLTVQISLDAELISDNVFAAEVNGIALAGDGLTFSGSNDATLAAIAEIFLDLPEVSAAAISEVGGVGFDNTITLTRALGYALVVDEVSISGGVSQAEASVAESSTPVIWTNQNAPIPELPFVTLQINSVIAIGDDITLPVDADTGLAKVVGTREFTLSMQTFGETAFELAENLSTSLDLWVVQNSLREAGIYIVNREPIGNVAALLDTQWEARCNLDVLFRIASPYGAGALQDAVGVIETIEATGTVGDLTVIIEGD